MDQTNIHAAEEAERMTRTIASVSTSLDEAAQQSDAVMKSVAVIEARRDAPEWAETARRAYRISDLAPAPEPLVIEAQGR